MFIWFHFLLATCISASHSLVNLFLLSGSLNSFFLFLVLSVLKCVFYLSRCELMLFFLPFSYLYSLSPFSLAFNAEQFFSVILCTLPCIYSLCSLLDLLSDWYLNFSIYPLYFKNFLRTSKPLFRNCILCPISVLLKLSCAHRPPRDLSKNEDSGLVQWRDSWDSMLLTSSQETPGLLVCSPYSVRQGPRQHVKCHRHGNVCFQRTAPQSASVNPPPPAGHMTLGKLTCLFENPLFPLRNKDICCCVSQFLPWLSVIFSQHTPQGAWSRKGQARGSDVGGGFQCCPTDRKGPGSHVSARWGGLCSPLDLSHEVVLWVEAFGIKYPDRFHPHTGATLPQNRGKCTNSP